MSNYSNLRLNLEDQNSAWTKVFNLIPEESEVLDIGCSAGWFGAELIKRKKCTVDGIEMDPSDAKKASKVLRTVKIANVEQKRPSSLHKKKYDIIVFADVLEHLVDPASVLKDCKALLKPSGRVIFSIPNMTHISVRIDVLKGSFAHQETGILDKTHIHYYDLDEVERVFAEAGMKVVEYDSTLMDMPKTMVSEELSSVGLHCEERFFDHVKKTYGEVYQFVGSASFDKSAKPSYDHRLAAISRSPSEFINSHINNMRYEWEMSLKKLKRRSLKAYVSKGKKILNRVKSKISK